MPAQNLVSAEITQETKAEIIQMLLEIKSRMNFLLTLQPDEIQSMVKAGNTFAPFIDKAYNAVNAHPQIMPAVFDTEVFKKDYNLVKDLTVIAEHFSQITDSINNTLLAANSDAMTASLDVYASVKQNRDKVPGLNVVADDMAEFFRRSRKKPDPVVNK